MKRRQAKAASSSGKVLHLRMTPDDDRRLATLGVAIPVPLTQIAREAMRRGFTQLEADPRSFVGDA